MTQTETVNRLAVEHLVCPHCGAEPGKACRIVKRDGPSNLVANMFAGWPRATPHQSRRDPFIEAWSDGYVTAEADSIQAHR